MFSNAKSIAVNGISAKKITIDGVTLWEKGGEPSPYTEVEAISATGNAYIHFRDIGFDFGNTLKVDIDMQSPDSSLCYHGFQARDGGFIATLSNNKIGFGIHEWQGVIPNSDVRNRQIITMRIEDGLTYLSSNLGGEASKSNSTVVDYAFSLFSSDGGSYGYKGGGYVFGLFYVLDDNTTETWKTVIKNETQEVGVYNENRAMFIGNSAGVGSIFVVSEQSSQLMQLSIQPDGTPEQQQAQLLAIGAE